MPRLKINIDDYIGKKINKLTILSQDGFQGRVPMVIVKCDCGKEKRVQLYHVLDGDTKSCGCSKYDHCSTHKLSGHPLFRIWVSMRQRCLDPNHKSFNDYGAKGVSISTRWVNDFKAFYDWAIGKWKPGLHLDKDIRSGDKHGTLYCPECCCFVTQTRNNRNRGNTFFVYYQGESLSLGEWSERLGLSYDVLYLRLKRSKWSVERAFTEPLNMSQ